VSNSQERMGELDLCHDCGHNGAAYLMAACLTAVAFVLWKAGVWTARQPAADALDRWSKRGVVGLLWLIASIIGYAAWLTL
jgi:hypothetical protein